MNDRAGEPVMDVLAENVTNLARSYRKATRGGIATPKAMRFYRELQRYMRAMVERDRRQPSKPVPPEVLAVIAALSVDQ